MLDKSLLERSMVDTLDPAWPIFQLMENTFSEGLKEGQRDGNNYFESNPPDE